MAEIGSPLVMCPKCGKTSYTKLRREWYNYLDKDMTFIIPLSMLMLGIGGIVVFDYNPLAIALGGIAIAFSIAYGASAAKDIADSKKRMRDPEYLAELLRWRIIRQEEYEAFMHDSQHKNG